MLDGFETLRRGCLAIHHLPSSSFRIMDVIENPGSAQGSEILAASLVDIVLGANHTHFPG